ncbi:Glutaredoxin family protein [Perilla frutescens var. hirtella]|nr:Glutaredoxin family protein [Perilla frutescens var. frutescens]KAH6792576.1 Glutaredoxin family protein [Perilla frutescens var. hirtella]
MGCVSSTLLSQEEEFSQIGGSAAFSHHIVSLTSTTYGLLTLDPPPTTTIPPTPSPPPPPPRITLGSLFPSPLCEPRSLRYESINSWDLMSGLEADRFQPFLHPKLADSSAVKRAPNRPGNDENSCPNASVSHSSKEADDLGKSFEGLSCPGDLNLKLIDRYEMICPPNGENKVVIYTTTLRGVRKTFDDCNAVRSAMEGIRVLVCERDISMDRGFREELRGLMSGRESNGLLPPRVFVKGRYIGGAEEVMRVVEEGLLGELLQGMPRVKEGYVCEGCGGVRFLPCFSCNGSCKMVVEAVEEDVEEPRSRTVIVRCSSCNENGLVHCPVCT